jgi:hypothetical protein
MYLLPKWLIDICVTMYHDYDVHSTPILVLHLYCGDRFATITINHERSN